MLGRTKKNRQLDIFNVPLKKFIQMNHELVQASHEIQWEQFEEKLKPLYSNRGRPSVPPRKVLGMLLLKNRFKLSDEKVLNIWVENPYWQYFCGEVYFQKEKPFAVSEFSRFRRRIGEAGDEFLHEILQGQFGEIENKIYQSFTERKKKSFWARILST